MKENLAVSADGVQIRFDVQGEGEPALVFVHGWPGDRSNWRSRMDLLAEKYTMVTIDLAGFGESDHNRDKWTMSAFGKDVVAVVKKLDLDQVVLVGFSMGDKVIVEAATFMPERVILLVGIDTFKNVDLTQNQEQIDKFTAPFRTDFSKALLEMTRSLFPPNTDSSYVEKILLQLGESGAPPDIALPVIEEYMKHDITPALKEIKVPIHCINSDLTPTNIEDARKYISSFEVVTYSGEGHLILWENPVKLTQLIADIVKDFLGENRLLA